MCTCKHTYNTHKLEAPKFRFAVAYSSRKPFNMPAVANPQVWVTMKLEHVSFYLAGNGVSDEVTSTLYSEGSQAAI